MPCYLGKSEGHKKISKILKISEAKSRARAHAHTHTHAHTYIELDIYTSLILDRAKSGTTLNAIFNTFLSDHLFNFAFSEFSTSENIHKQTCIKKILSLGPKSGSFTYFPLLVQWILHLSSTGFCVDTFYDFFSILIAVDYLSKNTVLKNDQKLLLSRYA